MVVLLKCAIAADALEERVLAAWMLSSFRILAAFACMIYGALQGPCLAELGDPIVAPEANVCNESPRLGGGARTVHQSRLRVALRRVPGMPTLPLLGWWCLSLLQAPLLCGVAMCACVHVCACV